MAGHKLAWQIAWRLLAALLAAGLVLPVAGCGDRNDSDTQKTALSPIHEEIDRLLETAADLESTDPARSRELLDRARSLLETRPDPKREAQVLSELARVLVILGEAQQAVAVAEQALELATEADAEPEIVLAAYTLGMVHARLGDYDLVLELANRSRAVAERIGDQGGVAKALNMIGVVHRNRGELADALASLLEAASIHEHLGDREGHARVLNNLGLVYWNLGNLDAALEVYEQTLAIHRETGNLRDESSLLNNVGLVLRERGDLAAALEHFLRSKEIKERTGERATLAATLSNIGLIYQELGRPEEALEHLERAYELRTRLGDQHGIARSLLALAATYHDMGDSELALRNAFACLEAAKRLEAKVEIKDVYSLLATIAEEQGDSAKALSYLRLSYEIERELIDPERYKQVIDQQARLATRTKEREIALLRHQREIAELTVEQERILRYASLVAAGLLLVLLITVWSRSRLRASMNRLLADTNQELRSSEDRFRRLFDDPTTPKAVVVLATCRIANANDSFAALCGNDREELLGAAVGEIGAPWLEQIVKRRANDSGSGRSEELVTGPDQHGRHRDLEVWSSGHQLPDGIALLITIRDVTERRRLAEETERARKLEAVGQLAGGIAHEFNNAMAALLGYIGLARLELTDTEAADRTLRDAEAAVLATRELTSRLIAFSPGGVPRRALCEIGPLVRNLVDGAFGGRVAGARLEVEHDLPKVRIDPLQIQQALRCILLNAAEASGEGNEVLVKVGRAEEDDTVIRIEIGDRGPGITEANRSRIFEPFFTTKDGARGLGLTSSYTIVLQHRGRLEHRPRSGGGTLFVIELPSETGLPAASSPEPQGSSEPRSRILIVEDDPAVKHIYRRVLPEIGYEPVVVADGAAAITQYRTATNNGRPFDLVLIDHSLPGGLDGKEVFLELRSINRNVIAVLASSYADDPILAKHRSIGFTAALSKPFTLDQLDIALKGALLVEAPRRH